MTSELLVLGGGPAGVGAAFRAARAGRDVTLIEAAPFVGGAASSHEIGGMRVDLGSHRLHPSIAPEILADLRTLLGDDLQIRPRNGRIRLAGRWLAFPLQPKDLVRNLPRGFALAAARDALTAPLRKPREETFAEMLRASLGPAMCESFYFPYARKIWGLDPQEISAEQARKRVSADTPWKLLRRVLLGSGGGGSRGSATFLYPRRGYGQISEALADAAVAHGARLELGRRADTIHVGPDEVEVTTTDGGSYRAASVWSTVPLPALAAMLEPAAPAPVMNAAARLKTRAMVLVYLKVPQERYSDFDAHYLPEAGTPVTRISEPKNYRSSPDDPKGSTVLCAEIPCRQGDEVWDADEAASADVVLAALEHAGLPRPEVDTVFVHRLPHAYPILDRGFESAVAEVETWVSTFPRLLSFGRQGLFVHDNAHHALAMAWAAADAWRADGTVDPGAWAAARMRFAQHVVED